MQLTSIFYTHITFTSFTITTWLL